MPDYEGYDTAVIRQVLARTPRIILQAALAMFAVGVLLVGAGTYLDVNSWWQDRPFLVNLLSSFTSAMFGIPLALIALSAMSRLESRHDAQMTLNERMVGSALRFGRELERCGRPDIVSRLRDKIEFSNLPIGGHPEEIQNWWLGVRDDFVMLITGDSQGQYDIPPDWEIVIRRWNTVTEVLEEAAAVVQASKSASIDVVDENQLRGIGRFLRQLNGMPMDINRDRLDGQVYPMLVNYYFTLSHLLVECRVLTERIGVLSEVLTRRG
jgi:hypothetical protein